jgi:hypothetical protein
MQLIWLKCYEKGTSGGFLPYCSSDEKTRHEVINSMVAIDVNATLSIVAADGGDANGGLKGLRGQLRPITAHQIVMELSSKLSLCRR